MKIRAAVGGLILLSAICRAGAAAEPGPPPDGCASAGKLNFVCGFRAPEDLEAVPGTPWIVVSGMTSDATPGELYLVDTRSKQRLPLEPAKLFASPKLDSSRFPGCVAPDTGKFAPHGLNMRAGKGKVHTLYVINHGGRESIEVFAVDTRGETPAFQWIGCAAIDSQKVYFNGVAALPDGGLVVTSMFDPTSPQRTQITSGVNTGAVYEWQPRSGFRLIPGSEAAANNGIEVSADGQWLYVNAWGAAKVLRLSRSGAQRSVIDVDFTPDNIRRAPDGTLLISGPSVKPSELMTCREPACAPGTTVMRLDPESMKLSVVGKYPATPHFNGGTTALQVGDTLWLASVGAERIAWTPLK